MTIVIPIDKYTKLNSYKDLLDFKEIKAEHLNELQEWLDPLIKTSQFMHFFNNELHSLPLDILQEVHDQTKLKAHQGLDHVFVVDRIPRDDPQFTKSWIRQRVVELCKKHHARFLNPIQDIYFEEDEMEVRNCDGVLERKPSYKMVILIDGWDHLSPLPDMEEHCKQQGRLFHDFKSVTSKEYRELVDLLDSDSDEEADKLKAEALERKRKEEEEQKKKEEELKPKEWACEICTFINSMNEAGCGICGQGKRPSMD
jgi:rubrerythrin